TGFAAMTVAANRHFFLQFDAALTMTHHATNLDLPGEANITTAAGDVAEFFSTGANTVQCVNYTRADGMPVVSGSAGSFEFVSTAAITAASSLLIEDLAAGYDYHIVLEAFGITTDAQTLWMRFSDDGTTIESDATDYGWQFQKSINASNTAVGGHSDSEIQLSGDLTLGNDTNSDNTVEVTLLNPAGTTEQSTCYWIGHFWNEQPTPQLAHCSGSGVFRQGDDAIVDVQFSFSGGSTFKAQGDITVWRRQRS
ncbi:MAG: hypothetical protein ACR2PS_01110, partial [Pseudomonadales bacterium]